MKDDTVEIAYFGFATFKITTPKEKRILIDPYIVQNPQCQKSIEDFCDVDLILVSHGAFDHLGDTTQIMRKSKAILICGPDVAKHALQEGIPKERVRVTIYGDEKELEGIQIKTVWTRHFSRIESEKETYYGASLGFVVTLENKIRIYHTGDTSLFSDLKLIGMLYRPNILLTCISRVALGDPCEMTPSEAALATLWVAPDVVVPMHYPDGSDEPQKFLEAVKIVAPNVEPIIIEPNRQITYSKYQLRAES